MAVAVEMPKLGNTVEECVLTAWRKRKGDVVASGEVIADIETDKTAFELTATSGGTILETFFDAGALVPVFTAVCVIGAPGERIEEFRPAISPTEGHSPPATAVRTEAGGRAAVSTAAPPIGAGRLSPRARRFSREHEFRSLAVTGTGPGGRVLEGDLRDLLPRSTAAPALEPGGPVAPPAAATMVTPDGHPARAGERPGTPLTRVRQTIADRLRAGLSSTAQYTLQGSANAQHLLALRRQLKASPDTAEISIGDLVLFCAIRALLEVPDLNAELVDGVVYRHARVHMAFACDTSRGLVVPVVRDSQNLSLRGLSRRITELTGQAVAGGIAADDLSGGTFTVSNLGGLGIEAFTPILNPPQVAILGVDAIQVRPVRNRMATSSSSNSIGLSLTVDHQVIDGAPGARFLGVLKSKIEAVRSAMQDLIVIGVRTRR